MPFNGVQCTRLGYIRFGFTYVGNYLDYDHQLDAVVCFTIARVTTLGMSGREL